MAPEFHLAESTLAPHLLPQHLEGPVDIVGTNEILLAHSSWMERSMGPTAKSPRSNGARTWHNSGAEHPRYEPTSIFQIVPPMGTIAANWKKRRLRFAVSNGPLGDKEQ